MKTEQIECSETSAYIIQTPGKYPKENVIHSEHGESLKSRINNRNIAYFSDYTTQTDYQSKHYNINQKDEET